MLKLKEIEICGFKSFPDRTKIEINSALTIIVGPNGSGKSNIAEAVLWAIGEQSPKSLRGSKMADVIFQGTKKRLPSGFAEVFLTFIDSQGQKIKIGRRLTRNSESSYIIDGNSVRLKDIHEFCYKNNISVQGSFLVEQGRVEAILSMSSQERRELFEEVAGIAHYKENRKVAETKLQNTLNNLLRLNDIILELENEVNNLKKQAQKAERASKILSDLQKKRYEYYGRSLNEFFSKASLIEKELSLFYDSREIIRTNLLKIEAEIENLKQKKYEEEENFKNLNEKIYELNILKERLENDNKRRIDQIVSSRERIQQIEKDLETLSKKLKENEKFSKALIENKNVLNESLKEASLEVKKKEEKIEKLKKELEETEKSLKENEKALFLLAEERSSKRSIFNQIEEELKRVKEKEERYKKESEKLINEKEKYEELLYDEETTLQQKEETLNSIKSKIKDIDDELEKIKNLIKELKENSSKLEKAEAQEVSKLNVLIAQLEEQKSNEEKRIEEINPKLKENRIFSLISHLDEKSLKVLELILGDSIEGYRIDSLNEMKALLKNKEELNKRIGFFLKRENKQVEEKYEDLTGFSGFLNEVVKVPEFLKESISNIPRFKTIEDALAFNYKYNKEALAEDDTVFVSKNGFIFVGKGKDILTTSLKLSKEIENTKKSLEELSRKILKEKEKIDNAIKKEEELILKRNELQKEFDEMLKEVNETRIKKEKLEMELKRILSSIELHQFEKSEIERLKNELFSDQKVLKSRLVKIEEEIAKNEGKISFLEEEKKRVKDEIDKLADDLYEKKINENQILERLNTLNNEELKYKQAINDYQSTINRLESEKELLLSRIKRLEEAVAIDGDKKGKIEEEISKAKEKKTSFESLILTYKEELESKEKRKKEIEEELKEIEREINDREKELLVKRTNIKTLVENYSSFIPESVEEILEKFKNSEFLKEDEKEKLLKEIHKLNEKLDEMGPQNFTAYEEYESKKKRLDFLLEQKEDLNKAINDLKEVIKKINETIKERYFDAFKNVNKAFSELFKVVFEGGEAYLKLEDEENPLESGIEIFAQPKGKKVLHNIQLSGGEKALVALTLLFAILSYKSQPFFILDEIDAPLDEANIERVLSKLLMEFKEKTQFVLITHNKRTMELGETIYGVTMQESGVSQIFSISLKDLVRQS